MPRINNPKPPKRAPKIDTRRVKKKPCAFCQHGVASVDYKDLAQLRKYISDRGKIRGRRVSGNCQQHQRDVIDAIKTARELALLQDGALLVNVARDVNATAIVKGLRAVSDFESELQMAQMNRSLSGGETLFIPTSSNHSFIASRLLRELVKDKEMGGRFAPIIP